MSNVKNVILTTIDDLVHKFLYYDRSEDEELETGDIERAIKNGVITPAEIISRFEQTLKAGLENDEIIAADIEEEELNKREGEDLYDNIVKLSNKIHSERPKEFLIPLSKQFVDFCKKED